MIACDALGIAVPQQLDTPRRLGELGQLVRRPPETDAPTDTDARHSDSLNSPNEGNQP